MSGDSGLSRGLQQGLLQGVKAGGSRANLLSGVKQGLKDSTATRLKMQDPALLTGNRLPWIYTNADNAVNVSTYTHMVDFTNIGAKWAARGITNPTISTGGYNVAMSTNGSAANRPWIFSGTVAGLDRRNYLDFRGQNGTSSLSWLAPITSAGVAGNPLLSNAPDPTDPTGVRKTSATTVMMVMKVTNASSNVLLYMNGLNVPGDCELDITTTSGLQNMTYTLLGNQVGNIRTSVYRTANMSDLNDWCLVTVKSDIRGPVLNSGKGAGSEQQIFVNGKLQHELVSNDWSTGTFTTTTFSAGMNMFIGANSSGGSSINLKLASFLLLPYWANESEQLLLENYFRWYYTKRF